MLSSVKLFGIQGIHCKPRFVQLTVSFMHEHALQILSPVDIIIISVDMIDERSSSSTLRKTICEPQTGIEPSTL